jgi:hypothetical protein
MWIGGDKHQTSDFNFRIFSLLLNSSRNEGYHLSKSSMDVYMIDKNIQIVLDYIKKGTFIIISHTDRIDCYLPCDKCLLKGLKCGRICRNSLEYIKDHKLFPQEFI